MHIFHGQYFLYRLSLILCHKFSSSNTFLYQVKWVSIINVPQNTWNFGDESFQLIDYISASYQTYLTSRNVQTQLQVFQIVKLQCQLQQSLQSGRRTITRTSARSFARNSCSMQSRMFFQPSCSMSLCRCASPNTVRAANCALALLPNEIGMFSTDCNIAYKPHLM